MTILILFLSSRVQTEESDDEKFRSQQNYRIYPESGTPYVVAILIRIED